MAKGRSCLSRSMYPARCLSAEYFALSSILTNTHLSFHRYIRPSPSFILTYAHPPISIFSEMKFTMALIVCLLVWMFVFLTVTQIDLGNYSFWLQISWLLVYLPLCCGALIISILWTFAIGLHEHPNGMDRLFRTWLHIPPLSEYGFPW